MDNDKEGGTPEELRALLDDLGINPSDLGRMLGYDRTTPHAWLSGRAPLPRWVPVHLRILLHIRQLAARAFVVSDALPLRLTHLAQVAGRSSAIWNETAPNHSIAQQRRATLPHVEDAKETAMTAAEFSAALAEIGWRQADFVRHVGCGAATASRWASGDQPIPAWVPAHLDLLRQIRQLQQFLEPRRERKPRSGL